MTMNQYEELAKDLIFDYNRRASCEKRLAVSDYLIGIVLNKVIHSHLSYNPIKQLASGKYKGEPSWVRYCKYKVNLLLQDEVINRNKRFAKEKKERVAAKFNLVSRELRQNNNPLDILIDMEEKELSENRVMKMIKDANLTPINESYLLLLIKGKSLEEIAKASGVGRARVYLSIKDSLRKIKCIT